MVYKIAGLTVEIHGNCKLNKSQVVFVKPENSSVYIRETALKTMQNTEILPSGESLSPDGISAFAEETENFGEGLSNQSRLIAGIAGCAADGEGNSLYVQARLKDYNAGAAQNVLVPDFRIQYKILPEISAPCGEPLGYLRGFAFYKDGEQTVFTKKIDLIDEILVKITFNAAFSSADIELFDVSDLGGLPLTDRIHSYVGEAFAYMALTKGRVVFHSSALSYAGSGVCFSAPSGTGKSTHTGLWKAYYENQTEIINDDTPVLYVNSENTVLCGTPWSGKTALNINKEVPLKGIVFLCRSKENYIKRLSNLEALKAFFGEAKIPQHPQLFHAGLDIAGKILEHTPVYLLGCNISKEAVDLVKNTLQL